MVYKPSDDSFLLLNEIIKIKGDVLIDVGTGSGFIAENTRGNFSWIIATDIDKRSIHEAKRKLSKYSNIDLIQCNLFDAIRENSFDFICFNPPYLPKDEFKSDIDIQTVYINYNGRNIIEEFLEKFLEKSKKAKCYIVISSLTNLEEILNEKIKKRLRIKKISSIRKFFEEISVFEISVLTS